MEHCRADPDQRPPIQTRVAVPDVAVQPDVQLNVQDWYEYAFAHWKPPESQLVVTAKLVNEPTPLERRPAEPFVNLVSTHENE